MSKFLVKLFNFPEFSKMQGYLWIIWVKLAGALSKNTEKVQAHVQ
jgi:hypothetical protein